MNSSMFTSGQLPPNFPRFQTRKALFILELQNDFLSVGGKLPVNTDSGFVDSIKTLVPVFRDLGDIVWVRSEFDDSSVTADPPEIEEAFSSKERSLSAAEEGSAAAADGDDDDDVEGQCQDGDEQDEHCRQAVEDDANVQSQCLLHGGVPSKDPSRSTSSRPSDRVRRLRHRTSAGVKARQAEPLASKPNQQGSVQSSQPSPGPGFIALCCMPGSWGADFVEDMKPTIDKRNDRLVVKSCFSAFDDTSLLLLLRSNFVTELYICGSRSHASVYATAADAVRHGFSITIVEDCLGYRDEARHMEAMRQMADVMGADGITSTELIDEITGAPPMREDSEEGQQSIRGTAHSAKLETAQKENSGCVDIRTVSKVAIEGRSVAAEDLSTRKDDAGTNSDSRQRSDLSTAVLTTISTSVALAETQHQDDNDASAEASTTRIKIAPAKSDARTAGQDTEGDSDVCEISTASSNELGNKPNGSKIRSDGIPIMRKYQGTSKIVVEGTVKCLQLKDSKTSQLASASSQTGSPALSAPTFHGNADSLPSNVQVGQKVRPNADICTLGPNDKIGEGDSQIICNVLPRTIADDIHRQVKDEVRWQKMYHRTGEVPRLVAVQGEVGQDGSIPVYRHPADESPPLQCFSPTVMRIRDVAAKILQQPLNHVLIQLYRDGQDNISEHSDKTLDIVHGSRIVNFSLGAQRVMTLRTKKAAREDPPSKTFTRQTQRVPLSHNSMFVLGQKTNRRWLHGVRPDKRPSTEKTDAEMAFSGERISLTFRHIGTFLDQDSRRIWGQGACAKSKSSACRITNGDPKAIENMIRAFGEENQRSDFDWEAKYGSGFNVLNFVTRSPKLIESDDAVSNLRVKLYLAEMGVAWRLDPRQVPEHAIDEGLVKVKRRPKFIDTDPDETEVEGDLVILFYLNKFYDNAEHDRSSTSNGAASARVFNRVSQAEGLFDLWRQILDVSSERGIQSSDSLGTQLLRKELELWESRLEDSQYIAGETFAMADCAFWPVLKEIVQKWKPWGVVEFPNLTRYHELILRRAMNAKDTLT